MSESMTAIEPINEARRLLEKARNLQEILQVRDAAMASAVFAEAQGASEMAQMAKEIQLRAERKAGNFLAGMQKQNGGDAMRARSQGVTELPPTYADLGIYKMQAVRWQLEATVPDAQFETWVEERKEAGKELTATALQQLAARQSDRMAVHYSSETPEWYTPQKIIQRVCRLFGEIDLDPCSNPGTPNVPAKQHFTIDDNGLLQDWRGKVYMNPPYSDAIAGWVTKLCREYNDHRVSQAIALVPSRTDTDWFRKLRDCAICFIHGRLHFNDSPQGAPFPSCAVYFGFDLTGFDTAFGDIGDVWVRWSN